MLFNASQVFFEPISSPIFVTILRGGFLMAALQPGEIAPDFELPAVTGKQRHAFKLSDYRGQKNVVLAFYPLDWSPT
jgi:hypothetical protein